MMGVSLLAGAVLQGIGRAPRTEVADASLSAEPAAPLPATYALSGGK